MANVLREFISWSHTKASEKTALNIRSLSAWEGHQSWDLDEELLANHSASRTEGMPAAREKLVKAGEKTAI